MESREDGGGEVGRLLPRFVHLPCITIGEERVSGVSHLVRGISFAFSLIVG